LPETTVNQPGRGYSTDLSSFSDGL
jgi:hypothetical protein